MTAVLINPHAADLGPANAVLNARATRHYEQRFAGPLSIKTVIAGRATWETDRGRFELVPGSVLLINDGEEYTITVDALQPVETYCFFFARGFVEDAYRAATTGSAALLRRADVSSAPRPVEFCEPLQFDASLIAIINRAHDGHSLEDAFYAAAFELVRAYADIAARTSRLPSLRASTREELARRLRIATAYLHANADRGVTIAEAAREACLSPFHFHRLFTRFHGVTPHRYLGRLRLERARALLCASEVSVAEVAYECGFESAGSFATLFKRTFGVTPAKSKNREDTPPVRALP
ncbi:MAG TPA: AraC family transcriptional regulator [Thermoanaerobaculia bacterium]|nr:AraC family transcriptional regulator [Thermoanaerobaculia bacterium]